MIIRVPKAYEEEARAIWPPPDYEVVVVKLCTVCEAEPSRFHGGPCDDCERELGTGC